MLQRAAYVFALAAMLIGVAATGGTAQTSLASPILIIDSERLFNETLFGQRVASDRAAQEQQLQAESAEIAAQLEIEEQELTDARPDMPAAEFQLLADAFDEKVQGLRATQDGKARDILQAEEQEQLRFLRAAEPVFAEVMRETGASAILERRAVFISASAIDVTDRLINMLDEQIGDGAVTEETTPEE